MFHQVFLALLIVCILIRGVVYWRRRSHWVGSEQDKSFSSFQLRYLVVYALACTSDWLQGAYVYALYSDYGYGKKEVGELFIAGYAASALFGTFVASMADRFGRKRTVYIFCLTYGVSCATKHFPNFWVLLFGRALAGASTSILFTVFEAWMVCEHKANHFIPSLVSETFAKAVLVNGISAIAAGQAAGLIASKYGKVLPFDLAILDLCVLALLVSLMWGENYGNKSEPLQKGFKIAFHHVLSSERIRTLGFMQSLYESSMFLFVFLWTPALQNDNSSEIPHGTIFSTFMVALMIGSTVSDVLLKVLASELVLRIAFAMSVFAFLTCALSERLESTFTAFLVFEVAVGMYFPAVGTIRAKLIPEESRSTIMNIYRIPLNFLVMVVVLGNFDIRNTWKACIVIVSVALALESRLAYLLHRDHHAHELEALTGDRGCNGTNSGCSTTLRAVGGENEEYI
uniref:Molybdate-anion transporter n=1 Tax=Rhodosorus marinus TaxID=101924 RepID=A0A7S3E7B1_9RHOD|mmetsp:Transcript_1464/g.4743  ORF Transcript_1464/g.4743 Transcript_1464/m.4743 type:complete len:457 (+) Transcript_1464:123-1493(+)